LISLHSAATNATQSIRDVSNTSSNTAEEAHNIRCHNKTIDDDLVHGSEGVTDQLKRIEAIVLLFPISCILISRRFRFFETILGRIF
jgi:hypothetical protein